MGNKSNQQKGILKNTEFCGLMKINLAYMRFSILEAPEFSGLRKPLFRQITKC